MNLEGFWFLLEDFIFFGKFYFCLVKYLSFNNSSFEGFWFLLEEFFGKIIFLLGEIFEFP
jgi:hypothetical protein